MSQVLVIQFFFFISANSRHATVKYFPFFLEYLVYVSRHKLKTAKRYLQFKKILPNWLGCRFKLFWKITINFRLWKYDLKIHSASISKLLTAWIRRFQWKFLFKIQFIAFSVLTKFTYLCIIMTHYSSDVITGTLIADTATKHIAAGWTNSSFCRL